jgi:transcriptional regulator with XRE-family HTH domain
MRLLGTILLLPIYGNILHMTKRDSIANTVGKNIRELRLDRGLTLARLAEHAGTSVRTLVEVESGRANASLATLGAIADALGVDFGRLAQPREGGEPTVTSTNAAPVVWSDKKGSEARLVVVSREPQSVELWVWSLEPGSRYQASADPDGTDVMILVTRGALGVSMGDPAGELTEGMVGLFSAESGYELFNAGEGETSFALIHVPPTATRGRYTRDRR